MVEITFLGTSSMVPTKERNVQGIFLEFNGEGILIDCGEGTQRQMAIAGINRNKVKKILISHWHGDHVSGLVGLIQTIGHNQQGATLEIFGPKGTKLRMKHLMQSCIFYNKVAITITELTPKKIETFFENEHYKLATAPLEHTVPCIGYKFITKPTRNIDLKKAKKFGLEPGPLLGQIQKGKTITHNGKKIKPQDVSTTKEGKSIGFILDTKICKGCSLIAKDADVLVSECVYAADMEEKAIEFKHLTAKQIAQCAHKANTKKLVLTHFSQRYKDVTPILKDAKKEFKNTHAAKDFMKIKV